MEDLNFQQLVLVLGRAQQLCRRMSRTDGRNRSSKSIIRWWVIKGALFKQCIDACCFPQAIVISWLMFIKHAVFWSVSIQLYASDVDGEAYSTDTNKF